MSRDIGELSESDEEELIEPEQGDKGAAKETDLEEELEAVWSGPVTRSRLRAQEESLQHLAKNVGNKPEGEIQDKPARWFNVISV